MDDWDDDLNAAMEGIRRKAKAWEDSELARMEEDLTAHPTGLYGRVPPPGYCHPYHERHKRTIIDWLDGKSYGGHVLHLPKPVSFKAMIADPGALPIPKLDDMSSRTITMQREKAFAVAPYVGRPFVYWWWSAVDDMGRGAGGEETHLAYTVPEYQWWGDDRG
ncbi:hypothetical protein AB0383_20490 [Amycolatopsis sp. NPDC051373]|uniref:hypothetical protein n=1 Tax=Amycolatopsis sp. NPDC051373 TaxID=3155801 RepID=UPI00344F66FC